MMAKGRRRYRPTGVELLVRISLNLPFVFAVEWVLLTLLQVRSFFPPGNDGLLARLWMAAELTPPMAVGFGLFWYWLVLVRRSRQGHWGAAVLYSPLISISSVVVGGALAGYLVGVPFWGMLLALAALILNPPLLFAQLFAGIAVGLWTGYCVESWFYKNRSPSDESSPKDDA
ncbi:hypothetical protein [Chthonomonas calidirosea]|uniref:hypothetical protein n=1 Tax=Chthonomonas calidirosea TaxID=454171 RepID=UPI000948FFAA|nr:hypothetical protein [Chthonomonas calidirosea]